MSPARPEARSAVTGSLVSAVFGVLLAASLAACSVAGRSQQPSSNPSESPAPSASGAAGFYLRAWQTQALEPHQTFGWLPMLTIADGTLVDGRIAVPAIYPGPLYVSPIQRSVTAAGVKTIVNEARKDGLLRGRSDFIETPAPGGQLAHLELAVDGVRYELTGDPASLTRCRCLPDPGTAGAFAAFWQRLSSLEQWIPNELGAQASYTPERLAVLAIDPVQVEAPIAPNEKVWPLGPFATFGHASGSDRCAVVAGEDLQKLLPVVKDANQLTRFVDAAGVAKSLLVRALVPGEPAPCQA